MLRKYTPQLLILATAILAGIGFWYFPWLSDDISYRAPFREYFLEGGDVTVRQIIDHNVMRYYHDNGRFANVAMTLLIFTPHIVQTAISVAACFLSMYIGLRVMQLERSVTAAMLCAFAFMVLMPWTDQMYVFDFQLNYLFGGSIGLLWMDLYVRRPNRVAALALTSLMLGLWQEAIGFPVFVAFVFTAIVYKKYKNRSLWAAALCLLLGLAWLYFSPGGQYYRGSRLNYFGGRSMIVWVYLLPTVLYSILLVIRLLRRGGLCLAHTFLWVSSLAAAAVSLVSLYGPRVGWWATLASLIGLIGLCRPYFKAKFVKASAVVLFAFMIVHLCYVDRYSYIEGKNYDTIISRYMAADDGEVVLAPMILREYAPLICMQKPYFGYFAHWTPLRGISSFYKPGAQVIFPLPVELASYKHSLGKPIAGTIGMTEYRGYMVGPPCSTEPSLVQLSVSYDTASPAITMPFLSMPFQGEDSLKYAWYAPNNSTLRALLHPIPLRIDSIR